MYNKAFLKNIKNIMFDIDGTLFSSDPIIADIYNEEFIKFKDKYNKPENVPVKQDIIEQIGKPVKQIFLNLVPELSEEERDELSTNILNNFADKIKKGHGHHYPDVFNTIKKLYDKGYKIFAASNGRYPYIKAVLEYNKTKKFFIEIPFVDNEKIHNKNELVEYLINKYKLNPEQTIVIGDRKSDIDAAKYNKCFFAACVFGHGNQSEYADANIFLNSITELLEYLET